MEIKYTEYILRHFYSVYEIPVHIQEDLAASTCKVTWTDADFDFFSEQSHKPTYQIRAHLKSKILVLFANDEDLIVSKSDSISVNFDWIAASFFFLSGYQEWHSLQKTSRFKAKYALQYNLQYHGLPLVNYYFDIFKEALERAYNIELLTQSRTPHLFLSHHVEKLNSAGTEGAWFELKKGRPHVAFGLVLKKLFGRDEWYNLARIIKLEERMGVQSTFFLAPRKEKGQVDYDISQPKYHQWIKALQGQSFEVGIFASKSASSSATRLGADLKRFKNRVFGNRFQSLLLKPKVSYRALEKNKIKYDNSFGFLEEIGFRNAYCYPFRPWHFGEDRPVEFIEIPLMVQEKVLQEQKFLSLRKEEAIAVVYDLMRQVALFNGTMSVSWQNIYFSDIKYRGWRTVYAEIIKSSAKLDYKSRTGYLLFEEFTKNRNL